MALDFTLLEDIVKAAFHADIDLLGSFVLPADIVEGWVNSQG